MQEKIFFTWTDDQRATINDHLVETKYPKTTYDYLFDNIRTQLNIVNDAIENKHEWLVGGKIPIPLQKESLDKIKIPHKKHKGKSVLLVGPATYSGLLNWFKVSMIVNTMMGQAYKPDFETFLQTEFFDEIIASIKRGKYDKMIEAERPKPEETTS